MNTLQIVYPPHVLYRYVEHFVIFVLCLCANAMWIIIIVPCTSKHTRMNDRHSHVRWSHSHHSTLARIRYAHTTCQIIVTKDPTARRYRSDWAWRARNDNGVKHSITSAIIWSQITVGQPNSHTQCTTMSRQLWSTSRGLKDLLKSLERWYSIYTTQHMDSRQVPWKLPDLSGMAMAPPGRLGWPTTVSIIYVA